MGRNIVSQESSSGLMPTSSIGTTTAPAGAVTPIVESTNPHDYAGPRRAVVGHVPGGTGGMPTPGQDMMFTGGAETAIVGPRGNVIGSAVRADQPEIPVKKYRIVNGGFAMLDGARTAIRAGKEVDGRQYDLKQLQRQGFKLEEITDDDELPLYSEPVDPLTPPLV